MNVYEILGISVNDSEEARKKAYRKLCAKYHPDNAQTGNREKFDEIQKAWGILNSKSSGAIFEPIKKVYISHIDLFTFSIISA